MKPIILLDVFFFCFAEPYNSIWTVPNRNDVSLIKVFLLENPLFGELWGSVDKNSIWAFFKSFYLEAFSDRKELCYMVLHRIIKGTAKEIFEVESKFGPGYEISHYFVVLYIFFLSFFLKLS